MGRPTGRSLREPAVQEGKILEEKDQYKGRRAHKVWWPYLSAECYVDPRTKLPLAIGDSRAELRGAAGGDISRSSRRTGTPSWTSVPGAVYRPRAGLAPGGRASPGREEQESFQRGQSALVKADYAEAARQLEAGGSASTVGPPSGSAKPTMSLGQYDLAIQYFAARWLKKIGGDRSPCPTATTPGAWPMPARGNLEAGEADFEACSAGDDPDAAAFPQAGDVRVCGRPENPHRPALAERPGNRDQDDQPPADHLGPELRLRSQRHAPAERSGASPPGNSGSRTAARSSSRRTRSCSRCRPRINRDVAPVDIRTAWKWR